MTVREKALSAKQASKKLLSIPEATRVKVLLNLSKIIKEDCESILVENQKDLEQAKVQGLSEALIDRLTLTNERIEGLAKAVAEIAHSEQVVGQFFEERKTINGLRIRKQRIPLGVIGMVFESRPNVVIDCSALAIKSANAMILKGGKESYNSNACLFQCVQKSMNDVIPTESIQLIDSRDRKSVEEMLSFSDCIDLIIPRGGESLIRFVKDNSKIPVIAHDKGLCHLYIHEDMTTEKLIQQTIEVVLNSKVQRPGVCNALETLIVHESWISHGMIQLLEALKSSKTKIFLDEQLMNQFSRYGEVATDEAWRTEYLDNVLSIKIVSSLDQAIEHIDQFGSLHTEGILAQEQLAIAKFQDQVDASCIMVNTSTRFNDGGQLGLGAELGISTTKMHAFGPMGAKEMTSSRFVVESEGCLRS